MNKSTFVFEPDTDSIAGYDYGQARLKRSPVSFDELRQLEETIGWRPEDAQILQRHGDLFREHAEHMVDSWRAVIGAQPHLAKWFFGPDGKPDDEYKTKVKKRFVQWVLDACFRPHDRAWLDYQIIRKRSGSGIRRKRRIRQTVLKPRLWCRFVI
jgi:hypothetical protein